MNEHFLSPVVWNYESEALKYIEPFAATSSRHDVCILICLNYNERKFQDVKTRFKLDF